MPNSLLVDQAQPPSAHLPTELLSLIFQLCLASEDYYLGCPAVSATSPPLTFTWICRKWRALAISMPDLWIGFSLGSSYSSYAREEDSALIQLFLDRAGDTLPLHIELAYGDDAYVSEVPLFDTNTLTGQAQRESHREGMDLLAETLAPVRHRWRTLAVRGLVSETLQPFLSVLALGASQLEFLVLSSRYSPYEIDNNPPSFIELGRCPQLHTLALLSPGITPEPFPDTLTPRTYEALTALTLGCTDSQPDALLWLQTCPNLESVSIDFNNAAPLMLPFATPLRMERLAHLALASDGFDRSRDVGAFLSLLRLPALESLELRLNNNIIGVDIADDDNHREDDWGRLADLIRLSAPSSLSSLSLLGTLIRPTELREVLALAPDLQTLTIDDALASEEVLGALNAINYVLAEPLCPSLETLEIVGYAKSAAPLARMALSRCSNADIDKNAEQRTHFQTLKRLELTRSKDPSLLEHPVFKECQFRGMVLINNRNSLLSPESESQEYLSAWPP